MPDIAYTPPPVVSGLSGLIALPPFFTRVNPSVSVKPFTLEPEPRYTHRIASLPIPRTLHPAVVGSSGFVAARPLMTVTARPPVDSRVTPEGTTARALISNPSPCTIPSPTEYSPGRASTLSPDMIPGFERAPSSVKAASGYDPAAESSPPTATYHTFVYSASTTTPPLAIEYGMETALSALSTNWYVLPFTVTPMHGRSPFVAVIFNEPLSSIPQTPSATESPPDGALTIAAFFSDGVPHAPANGFPSLSLTKGILSKSVETQNQYDLP